MLDVTEIAKKAGAFGFWVGTLGSAGVAIVGGLITWPIAISSVFGCTGVGASTANHYIQIGRDELIPEAMNAIKKSCWETLIIPPTSDVLIGASSILASAVWLPLVNSGYGIYSTLLFNRREQPSESINQTAIALAIVGLGALLFGVGKCCWGGYQFLFSSKQGGSVKKAYFSELKDRSLLRLLERIHYALKIRSVPWRFD